jgi:hypothetical protein
MTLPQSAAVFLAAKRIGTRPQALADAVATALLRVLNRHIPHS